MKKIQVDEVDTKRLLELASIGCVDLQCLLALAKRGLAADVAGDELVTGHHAGIVLNDGILMHIQPSETGLRAARQIHRRGRRFVLQAEHA